MFVTLFEYDVIAAALSVPSRRTVDFSRPSGRHRGGGVDTDPAVVVKVEPVSVGLGLGVIPARSSSSSVAPGSSSSSGGCSPSLGDVRRLAGAVVSSAAGSSSTSSTGSVNSAGGSSNRSSGVPLPSVVAVSHSQSLQPLHPSRLDRVTSRGRQSSVPHRRDLNGLS